VDEGRHSLENSDDKAAIDVADAGASDATDHRAPYRIRLRVALLLAIVSWVLLIGLVWVIAKL
jgi:hypothetical protein